MILLILCAIYHAVIEVWYILFKFYFVVTFLHHYFNLENEKSLRIFNVLEIFQKTANHCFMEYTYLKLWKECYSLCYMTYLINYMYMKSGTFLFHLINFESLCARICMTFNKSFSFFYGETFLYIQHCTNKKITLSSLLSWN